MIKVFAAVSMVFVLFGTSASFAQTKETMTIKVFFHNEKFNPNQEDCTKVFPTTRMIPKTKAVARAALEELFKGTTEEDRKNEFWSFEPEETRDIIKGLIVKSGVESFVDEGAQEPSDRDGVCQRRFGHGFVGALAAQVSVGQ